MQNKFLKRRTVYVKLTVPEICCVQLLNISLQNIII